MRFHRIDSWMITVPRSMESFIDTSSCNLAAGYEKSIHQRLQSLEFDSLRFNYTQPTACNRDSSASILGRLNKSSKHSRSLQRREPADLFEHLHFAFGIYIKSREGIRHDFAIEIFSRARLQTARSTWRASAAERREINIECCRQNLLAELHLQNHLNCRRVNMLARP